MPRFSWSFFLYGVYLDYRLTYRLRPALAVRGYKGFISALKTSSFSCIYSSLPGHDESISYQNTKERRSCNSMIQALLENEVEGSELHDRLVGPLCNYIAG